MGMQWHKWREKQGESREMLWAEGAGLVSGVDEEEKM